MSHTNPRASTLNRSTASTNDAESPAPRAPHDNTRRQVFDSSGNPHGGGGMSPDVKRAIGDIAVSVARGEHERSIMAQNIAQMANDSNEQRDALMRHMQQSTATAESQRKTLYEDIHANAITAQAERQSLQNDIKSAAKLADDQRNVMLHDIHQAACIADDQRNKLLITIQQAEAQRQDSVARTDKQYQDLVQMIRSISVAQSANSGASQSQSQPLFAAQSFGPCTLAVSLLSRLSCKRVLTKHGHTKNSAQRSLHRQNSSAQQWRRRSTSF